MRTHHRVNFRSIIGLMVLCTGLLHAQQASADSFTIPLNSSPNCEICAGGSLGILNDGTGFHFQGLQDIQTVEPFHTPGLDGLVSYNLFITDPVQFFSFGFEERLPGAQIGLSVFFQPDFILGDPGTYVVLTEARENLVENVASIETGFFKIADRAVGVPEPTSGILLATSLLGLVGLAAWRRKQTA